MEYYGAPRRGGYRVSADPYLEADYYPGRRNPPAYRYLRDPHIHDMEHLGDFATRHVLPALQREYPDRPVRIIVNQGTLHLRDDDAGITTHRSHYRHYPNPLNGSNTMLYNAQGATVVVGEPPVPVREFRESSACGPRYSVEPEPVVYERTTSLPRGCIRCRVKRNAGLAAPCLECEIAADLKAERQARRERERDVGVDVEYVRTRDIEVPRRWDRRYY
ncbi:uncharacterized protein E0L32_002294 [Thyridium curvatum]|uniref:Uncharacterized protein n=1 Tax=Thyridium curvatum TaxID=1093900 RepID=A0A507APN2_9PEZI|nr:uncharacterized protein E0L32_002294 [Thyridium curvatum]TPX06798.1 hypothetical protein E0L32_002294 [Thyridium curvatum]